jgi:hypothetical protein
MLSAQLTIVHLVTTNIVLTKEASYDCIYGVYSQTHLLHTNKMIASIIQYISLLFLANVNFTDHVYWEGFHSLNNINIYKHLL